MKFLVRPRGYGKTGVLVRKLRNNPNAILLTINDREAKRLIDTYALPAARVMSYARWLERGFTLPNSYTAELLIDNIDLILPMLFHSSIAEVSLTDLEIV